jgi:peptide/nickel transport system substrate-binding protein
MPYKKEQTGGFMRAVNFTQVFAAFTFAAASLTATGKDITIALSSSITSMDPHYHNITTNNGMMRHVYDTLIRQDASQALVPGLARSWRTLDDTTWEFKLQRDVKFHDGSAFTADDVAFSFKRAPNVANSPASFATYLKGIKELIVKDAHTLIIKTGAPYPLLANDLATVPIVAKGVGDKVTTDDFNSGKAAIGTGPYKFAEYVPNQRIVLKANYAYWAGEEPWGKVTFKILTSAPARVAALLSGDADFIEGVPTADLANLSKDKKVALFSRISNRVIYLHLDSGRKTGSPFVFDKSGKPLDKNPLADARVRQAMSKAIDRNAITTRIMESNAFPAAQFLPDGFFGVSKNLKPAKPDLAGAKALLAEAGYPSGFNVTLHSPVGRYINDEKVAQAIAQMLTRIGIETKVETMPPSVFFTRGTKLEFSLLLAGWGAETGEASSPLRALVATFDKDKGMGAANRGRYSNAEVDRLLAAALATIDDTKRAALLAEATEVAMKDAAIVPLHYEISSWASKAGLRYTGRADQYTLAMDLRSTK